MQVPRPTRWALVRVTVLGTVGAWVIPMPWQGAVAEPAVEAPAPALGHATLEWLAGQCEQRPRPVSRLDLDELCEPPAVLGEHARSSRK